MHLPVRLRNSTLILLYFIRTNTRFHFPVERKRGKKRKEENKTRLKHCRGKEMKLRGPSLWICLSNYPHASFPRQGSTRDEREKKERKRKKKKNLKRGEGTVLRYADHEKGESRSRRGVRWGEVCIGITSLLSLNLPRGQAISMQEIGKKKEKPPRPE